MDLSLGFVDNLFDCQLWRVSCLSQIMLTQPGAPGRAITLPGLLTFPLYQIQYMNFVEIFNVLTDLSTIYFAGSSGCWASFVSSYYSILHCYNLFSANRLSIRLCSQFAGSIFGSARKSIRYNMNDACGNQPGPVWSSAVDIVVPDRYVLGR